MATYNLKHIANAYSENDLDTLIEECEDISARLHNLVDYLERDSGTIAAYLIETSIEIAKLGKAAHYASVLKRGKRVFRINGEWIPETYIESWVDYYTKDRGFTLIDAIDRICIDNKWDSQARLTLFGG